MFAHVRVSFPLKPNQIIRFRQIFDRVADKRLPSVDRRGSIPVRYFEFLFSCFQQKRKFQRRDAIAIRQQFLKIVLYESAKINVPKV